jgi:hypothetical protein
MIKVLLDRLTPPGQPSVMPEAVQARHPSLRQHARSMGRRHALDALSLLDAAEKEGVPSELPPRLFFKAAAPLGRRLRRATGRQGKGTTSAT